MSHHTDIYERPFPSQDEWEREFATVPYWSNNPTAKACMKWALAEVERLRAALEKIGRCCGNSNFVANEALGYGRVAHPDNAHNVDSDTND